MFDRDFRSWGYTAQEVTPIRSLPRTHSTGGGFIEDFYGYLLIL